jgi:hypothetical protein
LEGNGAGKQQDFAIAGLATGAGAPFNPKIYGTAYRIGLKKIPLGNQRFFTDIVENPRKENNFYMAIFSVH